jgi:hypothetical protein
MHVRPLGQSALVPHAAWHVMGPPPVGAKHIPVTSPLSTDAPSCGQSESMVHGRDAAADA